MAYATHSNKHKVSIRRSKKLWNKKGFTLLEVLIILIILGFLGSIMSGIFLRDDNQRRFKETRQRMEEIKKSILGIPGRYYVEGNQQFAGYVADMASLPLTDGKGQIESQWEQGSQAAQSYSSVCRRLIGWRGPYIERPEEGVLKDGWGNPFIFKDSNTNPSEIADGDMVIISYGADGLAGGSGFDEDITLRIRKSEYMAVVAGRAAEGVNGVTIYFNKEGEIIRQEITGLSPGDCFRFESRGEGEPEEPPPGRNYSDIPVGQAALVSSSIRVLYFYVEPGVNWLGVVY